MSTLTATLRDLGIGLVIASLVLAIPSATRAHTSGGFAFWEGLPVGGYSYWVYVCDTNMSGVSESRVIDALNEWNEIGGELFFNWTGWSASTCNANWGNPNNQVRVKYGPLGGTALGNSFVNLILGQVDQVDMTIDNDGTVTRPGDGVVVSYTHYTGTGSPSASQVDLESVLVHEFGHSIGALGHSLENEAYIMDDSLSNVYPFDPRGDENDERVYSHDTALYTSHYGTTH